MTRHVVYLHRRHGCLTAIAFLVVLAVVVTWWPVVLAVALVAAAGWLGTRYRRSHASRATTETLRGWWTLPDERFESELVGLLGRIGWTPIEWGGPDTVAVDPAGRRTAITWRRVSPGFEVGAHVVSAAIEAVAANHADRAMLVTTGIFSTAAFARARANDVQLIDGAVLAQWAGIGSRV